MESALLGIVLDSSILLAAERRKLTPEQAIETVQKVVGAAARRLHQINSHVLAEPLVTDLSPSNAEELIAQSGLILDGTDNLETRYLLNDLSVKLNIPWIYGVAVGSYGVVMAIVPERGPCFACVYPEAPSGVQPTCDVNGVLASATATVASLQVAAALRFLVQPKEFSGSIQTLDVWTGAFRQMSAGARDPLCRACGERRFDFLDERRRVPVSLCGRNASNCTSTREN